MLFIWVAIFAYFLFAINAVIDKYLLHQSRIGHPATYAFAIGTLSLVVIVLVPFGFEILPAEVILLAILAGALFTFAILCFFGALKNGEASRVVPIEGGFVPFFTLIFAYVLVGERLVRTDLWALALLIFGTLLITHETAKWRSRYKLDNILLAIFAALLFALSFTLTKQVFNYTGFINGLIWTRFGMAFGSLALLLDNEFRRAIFGQVHKTKHNTGVWFLGGQAIGALAGLLQNYAISLGSVSIVNALQGTQFAFLLAMTSFISLSHPKVVKEKFNRHILLQKAIAIILISIGVIILVK